MHASFDATIRWQVTKEAQDAFLVDALWVAAIPNARLAERLRSKLPA